MPKWKQTGPILLSFTAPTNGFPQFEKLPWEQVLMHTSCCGAKQKAECQRICGFSYYSESSKRKNVRIFVSTSVLFLCFCFFFPWTNQCLSEEPCSSVTFLWLTKSLLRFTSEGCINMGWWSNSVHLSDSAFLTAFEKLVIWNVADGWNCFSGSWGLSIPKLHQPGFGNWFTISSGPSGRH